MCLDVFGKAVRCLEGKRTVVFLKFKITIVYKEAFHFSLEVEFYFNT